MSTDQSLLRQLASNIEPAERRFYRKTDDVAARIRQLMDRQDLTQRELAERVDKSESYVSRVLSGGVNLTLKTIAAFEAALDADVLALPEPRERGPRRRTLGTFKTKTTVVEPKRRRANGVCINQQGKLTFTVSNKRNDTEPKSETASDEATQREELMEAA